MRRSKRKASAMATKKVAELASTTSTDASATNAEELVESDQDTTTYEGADLSGDEDDLHGPCNVRPSDADENPR